MDSDALADLPIHLRIVRQGSAAFEGDTRTSKISRALSSLVDYLFMETAFPSGVFLMTGTGIVPPESFSLSPGDTVRITIGELTLENVVGV
jgi:2-dehydro-3-deoxy-D-arabinonate dehydratase